MCSSLLLNLLATSQREVEVVATAVLFLRFNKGHNKVTARSPIKICHCQSFEHAQKTSPDSEFDCPLVAKDF